MVDSRIQELAGRLLALGISAGDIQEYSKGGKIHIKKSKRGTFTAAAKKHGKSVQAFASQVLANKGNYSPAMVKKANFARNASKWHADGGLLRYYEDGGYPSWGIAPRGMWDPEREVSEVHGSDADTQASTRWSNIDLGVNSPEELAELARRNDPGVPEQPVFDVRTGTWTLFGNVLPQTYFTYDNTGNLSRYDVGIGEPVLHPVPRDDREDKLWKKNYDAGYAHLLLSDVQRWPYQHFVRNANVDATDRVMEFDPYLPFIPEKKIRISDAGRLSGTEVSTNQLDTLAKYAGVATAKTGVDSIHPILGIAGQETALGTYPSTTYMSPEEMRDHRKAVADIRSRDNDDSFYRSNVASEILNNHHFYGRNPWADLIGEAIRQNNVPITSRSHWPTQGYIDSVLDVADFSDDIEKTMKKGYGFTRKQSDKAMKTLPYDSITDALIEFRGGRWNPGLEGTDDKVLEADSLLWHSPEIQKWWKESGKKWYEKGKKK